MWNFRVKIYSWSQGKIDEAIRQRNGELAIDAYLRLPARHVWLFVRHARFEILDKILDTLSQGTTRYPEEAVARGVARTALNYEQPTYGPNVTVFDLITCLLASSAVHPKN